MKSTTTSPKRTAWRSFAQLAGIAPGSPAVANTPEPTAGATVWQRVAKALGLAHIVGLSHLPTPTPPPAHPAPVRNTAAVPALVTTNPGLALPATTTKATPLHRPAGTRAVNAVSTAQARAAEATHAAAFTEGARACQKRWRSIFEATPAAAAHLAAYIELASNHAVNVDAAVDALNMMPAAHDWHRPERQGRNPRL